MRIRNRPAKAKSKTALKKKPVAAKPEPEPVDTLEQRLEEERRHRQEMTLLLLKQIKQTPKSLNLQWLAELCTYINSEAKLDAHMDKVLEVGSKRESAYVARQRSEGKVVPNNSLYYIELAKKEFYGIRPTETALERASEFLAMALYREAQLNEGLENVGTEFLTTYFKEALKIASHNLELAVTARDSVRAMKDLVTAHESSLMEAQVRVERANAMLRTKREGTAMSARGDLVRIGKISTRVNAGLLALGKIYLDAAERETVSRRKLQYNAEHAFAALAMVYQLTSSGEALNAIREVNEIQRGYLHRMARLSWKNAKTAAKSGDWKQADEHFSRGYATLPPVYGARGRGATRQDRGGIRTLQKRPLRDQEPEDRSSGRTAVLIPAHGRCSGSAGKLERIGIRTQMPAITLRAVPSSFADRRGRQRFHRWFQGVDSAPSLRGGADRE